MVRLMNLTGHLIMGRRTTPDLTSRVKEQRCPGDQISGILPLDILISVSHPTSFSCFLLEPLTLKLTLTSLLTLTLSLTLKLTLTLH